MTGEALDSAQDLSQLQRVWEQLDSADRRDPLVAARAALRAGAEAIVVACPMCHANLDMRQGEILDRWRVAGRGRAQ